MLIQRRNVVNGIFVCVFLMSTVFLTEALEPERKEQASAVVKVFLKEKTELSGTLDVYDNKAEKVRNLRTLKRHEEFEESEGLLENKIEYQDINTGEVVIVGVRLDEQEGNFVVKDLRIVSVEKIKDAAASGPVKSEFTDGEIQAAMKAYLDAQAKFTGTVTLYDEESQRLRQLELISLKEEVRRLGIYFISGSEFKDVESGQKIDIDITVEDNKKGALTVQSLRIRKVHQ